MSRTYSKLAFGLPKKGGMVEYDPVSGLPGLGDDALYATGFSGISFAELLAKPPSSNLWKRALVYDIGINGSLWMSNGSEWRPIGPVVLSVNTTAAVKTDTDTAWADLFQFVVPGNLMSSNSCIRVEPDFAFQSNATNKNLRVSFGSAIPFSKTRTASSIETPVISITNRSKTSQVYPLNSVGVRGVGGTGTIPTSSVDTSQDQVISVSASWGTAGTGTNSIVLAKCVVILEY